MVTDESGSQSERAFCWRILGLVMSLEDDRNYFFIKRYKLMPLDEVIDR